MPLVVLWTMSKNRGTSPYDPQDHSGGREATVDDREQAADEREAELARREAEAKAVLADRSENKRKILEDAEHRDRVSDARDVDADERENTASRAAFLSQKHSGHEPEVRRAAALDRRHSKSDRTSAAADRAELAREDAVDNDETPATE